MFGDDWETDPQGQRLDILDALQCIGKDGHYNNGLWHSKY